MQTTATELVNLYQAAADYQRSYHELRRAADVLGINPSARRNGLPLYRPEDVARVNQHLAGESEASK